MEKEGLSSIEAREKQKKFGANELPEKKSPPRLLILFNQFKSPLIYVLFFASVVTLFLGDFKDTIVILAAVFVSTILGFLQETKAQKALTALKNILTPHAMVIRDGEMKEILARDLVVGDLVILNTGEKIPADGKLLEAVELTIDEAMLTGEAVPIDKSIKTKKNAVYMGTTILTGRGKMEVTAIGLSTKIGEIAGMISEVGETETPLQKKISVLANFLAIFIGLLSILIFTTGLLAGKKFTEMFATSVALAVAAIPEGLVVALTVILAVGMQQILKRKALVRRLLAAETLGSVTVICTDKTGTLTEGRFKVVSWEATDPELAIKSASLCNNLADAEEKALWDFVITQNHYDPQEIREKNIRLAEIPFSSKRRYMAVTVRMDDFEKNKIRNVLFIKGAPETVLDLCQNHPRLKNEWEEKVQQWASRGERVLGMAYKEVPGADFKIETGLEDLTFLGLVGFSDVPRKEAKEVLRIAHEAGIKIKVLTGDFRSTAETVLKQLGVTVKPDEILEGEELKHLTPEELKSCITHIKLFTRIDPSEKLRIVQALQENGEVVALVGDGVNDAPALKKAEVGVVVGEASEVAKETADIVLLDSNLKTLIAAIEEGRRIFDNLRKVATYLLADAFGAVILTTGSLILYFFSGVSWPLPLTAAQILWINLITDGFPSLALTVDPKERGIMEEPPRRPQEAIISLEIATIIAVASLFSGLSALFVFYYFLTHGDINIARSVVFGVLGMNTLFYVFSCRSLRRSIFKINPIENPYLIAAVLGGLFLQITPFYLPFMQKFLGLEPLGIWEWLVVLIISILVVVLIELVKWSFTTYGKAYSFPKTKPDRSDQVLLKS